MAEIIDKDKKVCLGQMIRVKNLEKEHSENDIYVSLQVEDESGSGDTEKCILFTEIELSDIEKVKLPFCENDMIAGRIYPVEINKKPTNLIKVITYGDLTFIARVSETQLKTAEERALKNKEDLTEKSLWTDMRD